MRKTNNLSEQLSNHILEYWSFWKKLQTVSNNAIPYKYSDLFLRRICSRPAFVLRQVSALYFWTIGFQNFVGVSLSRRTLREIYYLLWSCNKSTIQKNRTKPIIDFGLLDFNKWVSTNSNNRVHSLPIAVFLITIFSFMLYSLFDFQRMSRRWFFSEMPIFSQETSVWTTIFPRRTNCNIFPPRRLYFGKTPTRVVY